MELPGILNFGKSTWSMMSKITPSSKSPVRNPQRPPSPQHRLPQPNHDQSWSNFQYRPLGNQQQFFLCLTQDDLILHVPNQEPSAPNLSLLSHIRSNLDEAFRIGLLATTNIIFYVQLKMTPSFKSPVRNPQCLQSPKLRLSQLNQVQSWWNFQNRPLSNHQHHLWCSTQDDPILQDPSQEPSTSSKPQT